MSRPLARVLVPLAVLAVASLFANLSAAAIPAPPPTRVAVVTDTLHGVAIPDPYRWLEDKDSPETRAWVRAQMAYTMDQLGKVAGRDQVIATLGKYTRVDARTIPTVRGERLFFTTRRADQQQPVLVMRETSDGPDVVLVDPNPLSADHSTSVTLTNVSLDGRMLVYGIRKGGEDEVELHVLDVDKKVEVPGGLPKARYFGVSLDQQNQGFWYSRWAPEGSRVRYHRLTEDAAKDALVFGDGLGPTEIPAAGLSENGRWLLIGVYVGSSGDDTRFYVKNVEANGPIVTIADSLHSALNVDMAGDQLVIVTNWKAPHYRVLTADPAKPQPPFWKEIVPETPDATIDNMSLAGGKIYLTLLQNVAAKLRAYSLDGTARGEVPLPGIGSIGSNGGGTGGIYGEWAGKVGYFHFSSFNRPATIYRYDLATGRTATWWTSSAPFKAEAYEVRQFKVGSTGGVQVPFFIVARKGVRLDGSSKVLLDGYGGFNVSITPQFSSFVASWLDLGGIYVSANLRGGSEFGEAWHKDGMLGNKQHVFDDFLNVSQWLLSNHYCRSEGLGIVGGSNGGLLVGAAMTQRPELFGAVLCEVPLLDMLRYDRFLVAKFWVPEYGSAENAEQFQWLRAYSPYQNVKPGVKYPPVMFVTGDSDTRVDPLHARKMAALMQSLHGDNPVLLHYDVSSGHSAGKSVDKSIEDNADLLQFLRWRLGMVPPTP